MEFDVRGALAKQGWKLVGTFYRVILIIGARDVQYRSIHGLVLRLLPVPGYAAANSNYASKQVGMCSGKPVIEPDRLRESHEHPALRSYSQLAIAVAGNLL